MEREEDREEMEKVRPPTEAKVTKRNGEVKEKTRTEREMKKKTESLHTRMRGEVLLKFESNLKFHFPWEKFHVFRFADP